MSQPAALRDVRLRDNLSDEEWDRALAGLGGHPLQSSLWGCARLRAERRFAVFRGPELVWMARVEERPVPMLGRVAWVPKGPVAVEQSLVWDWPFEMVRTRLGAVGFDLLVATPQVPVVRPAGRRGGDVVRTIWIDLSTGREAVSARLDKKWRNGVRRAAKEGVVVEQSRASSDVEALVHLCREVSLRKKFSLDLDAAFVSRLLDLDNAVTPARLFVARSGGNVVACALCLGVGRKWHYLYGASERGHPHLRAGEAVQWAVMEAAIEAGATCYDLEGIDEEDNPGTAAFKRKMGGVEITFPGQLSFPLSLRGRAIALALAVRQSRHVASLLGTR